MSAEAKPIKDFSKVLPEKIWKQAIPDKIREALSSTNWDALVILGVENVQYCSGAWLPMARGYLDRQNIVVWPRQGEPTYITGSDWIGAVRASSKYITRLVGYEEKGAMPPAVIVDTVAEVLRQEGLAKGLIGLEMLRTPLPFWNRLRELLREARFESCDDMFRRLRMVKTGEEIRIMATAARLTDDGIWKAFGLAKPGESELEVGYKVMLEILKNGCQAVPSLLLGTGEGARALGAPTERRLKVGDIVRLDLNSLYRGYYCDMGRMAVVGKPSAEQTKAYSDLLGLKKRILEFMRPGRNCGEVHAFCVEQAKRMDLKLFVYPYIGIGHTTGVNNDEFPKLNVGFEKWALEPGMIFDVEPDTIGPEGEVFHSEDMVLVTNDGVEVITQSEGHDWSELLVIPA